jgi:hypothetical protein
VADEDGLRVSREDVWNDFSRWRAKEGHTKLKNISRKRFWTELRRVFKTENIPFIENSEDVRRYLDGIKLRRDDEDEDEDEQAAAVVQSKDKSLDEFFDGA